MSSNVCQQCGACCANTRVAFHFGELDEVPGGHVPTALADRLDLYVACMRGTETAPMRCVALSGTIGAAVKCQIYEWRPSPCQELVIGSDGCNRARLRWGLKTTDWVDKPAR